MIDYLLDQYFLIRLLTIDDRIAAMCPDGVCCSPADGKQYDFRVYRVQRKETIHGAGAEKNDSVIGSLCFMRGCRGPVYDHFIYRDARMS